MRFELTEHIAIQVTDHSKAARFYQDVLGMELKEEKEGETVLRCGSHTLYVESNPKNHTFCQVAAENAPPFCGHNAPPSCSNNAPLICGHNAPPGSCLTWNLRTQ